MIVTNKTVSIHGIGYGKKGEFCVSLLPGPNDIDDAAWGSVAENPAVKGRIERGEYVVSNPKKLSTVIAESCNMGDLKKWSDDTRPAVAKAAKARIAEILNVPRGSED